MSFQSPSATADNSISLPIVSPVSTAPSLDLTYIRHHLEKANKAAIAIAAWRVWVGRCLLSGPSTVSPDWNNDYHLGGLLEAIHSLSGQVGEVTEIPIGRVGGDL